MAELVEQQSTEPLPWWTHTCRVGWKVVRYFWATFLVALVLPKAVDVLFSEKPLRSLPTLWPILEVVIDHPIWTLLTFLGLLLLTGLFWFGSRQRIPTAQRALTEQNRADMLKRLQLYYEQMLAKSLQGAVQVELGLTQKSAAVQNAASLSLRLPDQPDQPLPDHTSIVDAYNLAQHDLLILGEPGAGKSTLLLELSRYLVQQAEQERTQPLPVLLPLSSWATKQAPLQEWLIEQFAQLYAVPQKLSQQWITTEELLPLLDGLDEMEETARADCIVAINSYHKEHFRPLVVCSRTNEYETAARREKLSLHTAVVVQPLSPADVETHLAALGEPFAALRHALRKNSDLQKIATTPLMLQVLMLTYHGTPVWELSRKRAHLQEQIWADYVQRIVSRKGDANRYPLAVTTTWLSWLARQMRTHNQTVFFLELLQPDWLPPRQRTFYRWSVGLLLGLGAGLLLGLLGGLGAGLLGGLGAGLLLGLLGGLGAGLLSRRYTKIELAEALVWSWKQPLDDLLIGLFLGLLLGLLGGLKYGLLFGLLFGLFIWLFLELLLGFSTKQLTERLVLSPNEGIHRSIKHGLLLGLLSALPFGLFAGLIDDQIGNWIIALLFGLGAGLGTGLDAAIQHYLLRCWLRHTFPLHAIPFLEDATARILLRRVGGGYSFTHRLLLDYFADLAPHPTSPPSPPSHPASAP